MNLKNARFIINVCLAFTVLMTCASCGSISVMDEKHTEQLDWTLNEAGVSVIDAQTSNGAILVNGSDESQVVIQAFKEVKARTQADAEAFARQVEVFVEQNGNEVKIFKEHPKPPKHIQVSVRYEIQSPAGVNVNLRTSNGKIQIHGINGTIEAKTSNGAIDAQGGNGRVELETSNGKISVRDVMRRIHANSSNGKIEASLKSLQEEASFSTSNGAIHVEVLSGIAPVTATSSNGLIDVTLPSDFSGRLDAKTSNGKVRTEFSVTTTITGEIPKNQISGQIGDGGEAVVKLRTSNGSIDLRRGE